MKSISTWSTNIEDHASNFLRPFSTPWDVGWWTNVRCRYWPYCPSKRRVVDSLKYMSLLWLPSLGPAHWLTKGQLQVVVAQKLKMPTFGYIWYIYWMWNPHNHHIEMLDHSGSHQKNRHKQRNLRVIPHLVTQMYHFWWPRFWAPRELRQEMVFSLLDVNLDRSTA
jgi:hypothetical protein